MCLFTSTIELTIISINMQMNLGMRHHLLRQCFSLVPTSLTDFQKDCDGAHYALWDTSDRISFHDNDHGRAYSMSSYILLYSHSISRSHMPFLRYLSQRWHTSQRGKIVNEKYAMIKQNREYNYTYIIVKSVKDRIRMYRAGVTVNLSYLI